MVPFDPHLVKNIHQPSGNIHPSPMMHRGAKFNDLLRIRLARVFTKFNDLFRIWPTESDTGLDYGQN